MSPSQPEMLTRLSEAYRKLRNTFRYCLGNLYDFDPAKDSVEAGQLEEIDSWALVRTAELLERAQAAYDEYAFHKVYRGVYDFATVDLSAFYFDILKDRLYTAPAGSVRRRAAQTTLYRIADALVRVVAPLLSFTADEVWTHLPAPHLREKSVHLAKYVLPEDLRAQTFRCASAADGELAAPDCPARGGAEGVRSGAPGEIHWGIAGSPRAPGVHRHQGG